MFSTALALVNDGKTDFNDGKTDFIVYQAKATLRTKSLVHLLKRKNKLLSLKYCIACLQNDSQTCVWSIFFLFVRNYRINSVVYRLRANFYPDKKKKTGKFLRLRFGHKNGFTCKDKLYTILKPVFPSFWNCLDIFIGTNGWSEACKNSCASHRKKCVLHCFPHKSYNLFSFWAH